MYVSLQGALLWTFHQCEKKFKMAVFILVKVVTHNDRQVTHNTFSNSANEYFFKSTLFTRQAFVCNPCNRHIGKSLKN